MKTIFATIGVITLIVVITFFNATPAGRAIWNNWVFEIQKVDDVTNYEYWDNLIEQLGLFDIKL